MRQNTTFAIGQYIGRKLQRILLIEITFTPLLP